MSEKYSNIIWHRPSQSVLGKCRSVWLSTMLLDESSKHVTLLPCPPEFGITNSLSYICAPPLLKWGLQCNITKQTVEHKETVWISITSPGNESDSFLVHNHCPFDYCNTSTMKIILSDPDELCMCSHSGILCGQCNTDHSAVFGSSKCKKCSNRWISILAVFVVAGIVLCISVISTATSPSFPSWESLRGVCWLETGLYTILPKAK